MQLVATTDDVDLMERETRQEERLALGQTPPFTADKFPELSERFFYDEEFKRAFLDTVRTLPSFGMRNLESYIARVHLLREHDVRSQFTDGELSNEEAVVRLGQIVRMHFNSNRRYLARNQAYLILTASHTLWFWDAIGARGVGKVQICAFTRNDLRRVDYGTRILIPTRP